MQGPRALELYTFHSLPELQPTRQVGDATLFGVDELFFEIKPKEKLFDTAVGFVETL
jgi:hypothetical protein